MSVCELSWLLPGPWVPVTRCKEGRNSDAAGRETLGRKREQCEVGHLSHEASANHGGDTRLQWDKDPCKHEAWEETVSGERDKTTALHQGA